QCGAPVGLDDIFCGECGFVVRSMVRQDSRPRDTNAVERLEKVDPDASDNTDAAELAPVAEPIAEAVARSKSTPKLKSTSKSTAGTAADPRQFEEDGEPVGTTSRRSEGDRFVLQFSTGESFTVYGSGLVGRSPRPEPGEYFDQLVRVVDSSRSVSKTHLEFGQDAGKFWVKDRYSGNGTIVREPDAKPIRCHPDRRYRLVRGSRVDLGEQFFIVS
ncbi:MAG: FHA domain-containing protein, partial [Terrimesophilobacter sp.]